MHPALCNPREVGSHLAQALLPTLDPLGGAPPPAEPVEPVYTKPRTEGGLLPGNLHYLSIAVPKVMLTPRTLAPRRLPP